MSRVCQYLSIVIILLLTACEADQEIANSNVFAKVAQYGEIKCTGTCYTDEWFPFECKLQRTKTKIECDCTYLTGLSNHCTLELPDSNSQVEAEIRDAFDSLVPEVDTYMMSNYNASDYTFDSVFYDKNSVNLTFLITYTAAGTSSNLNAVLAIDGNGN